MQWEGMKFCPRVLKSFYNAWKTTFQDFGVEWLTGRRMRDTPVKTTKADKKMHE